jgi:hypothetical protein
MTTERSNVAFVLLPSKAIDRAPIMKERNFLAHTVDTRLSSRAKPIVMTVTVNFGLGRA